MHFRIRLCTHLVSAASLVALTLPGIAPAQEKAPAPKTEKTAKAPAPTTVVATVNGVDITRADLERAKKVLLSQNRMEMQPMNAEMTKRVEEAALQQLIAKELLYQAGRKLEIKDMDKQVQDRVAQSKARFPSPAEYEKTLKEMNMNDKDVETFAREDLVIGNLVEKEIASKITVSDEEAKKFYDENLDKFKQPETVRASHILVGADAKATAEEKKKAKEKAEAILKKLKEGADFAETAKKESSCPSSAQGGDLGVFGKGQMVPEFEKSAFSLKPGETSGVVETQFGYHIIKLAEKHDAETTKFDDVKERLAQYLKNQKVQKGIGDYVEELKKKGKVEILAK
ncbi:peptidylprolyl isomerase [Geobacter pickeringii]|uniref:Peptidylprolyl isomerase n=1 Tax=Geobacter pickeringii TaxID=345632 RepID=A0A0B5BFN5_9BACT|nr:peptidylprolyl isomerase [Geobacter pickeringii]AJE03954.1 peptidylprolyl isomerase [Geobacter pickeringii]